jgi:hypothetical protein
MKTITSLLAGLLLAGSAQSAVLTYTFSAEIYYLTSEWGVVDSSNVTGHTVKVGDTVTGHFRFDTNTHKGWEYNDGSGLAEHYYEEGDTEINALVANIGTDGLSVSSDANSFENIVMHHAMSENYNDAYLAIQSQRTDGPISQGFGFRFAGIDPGASTGIAASFVTLLDPYSQPNHFGFGYSDHSDSTQPPRMLSVDARLTSLTLVTAPVPEPATYAMLLSGLALLMWRQRTR